jgi:hypothetical protein
MAQYNLLVPQFHIGQIRSTFQDILVASTKLRVMSAEGSLHMDWPAQSVQLGAHTLGEVSMHLLYQNVDVPDPTPEAPDGGAIYWDFLLVNAGSTNINTAVNAITTAADTVAGAMLGNANLMPVGAAIIGIDALVRVLQGNGCDGIVAAQNWALTAAQLATMAGGTAVWNNWQNYPGTSSPPICGRPSNYDVNYLINSRALIPVPDLTTVHTSPTVAQAKVAQAGFLWFEDSFDPIGAKSPFVEDQTPAGGTMAPLGTTIHVTIATSGKPQ